MSRKPPQKMVKKYPQLRCSRMSLLLHANRDRNNFGPNTSQEIADPPDEKKSFTCFLWYFFLKTFQKKDRPKLFQKTFQKRSTETFSKNFSKKIDRNFSKKLFQKTFQKNSVKIFSKKNGRSTPIREPSGQRRTRTGRTNRETRDKPQRIVTQRLLSRVQRPDHN